MDRIAITWTAVARPRVGPSDSQYNKICTLAKGHLSNVDETYKRPLGPDDTHRARATLSRFQPLRNRRSINPA